MDNSLLALLACPIRKTPLKRISPSQLETLNRLIESGQLLTVEGETIEQPLESALMTEDDRVIYPVRDGFPRLIADQGIGTKQLMQERGFCL